MQTTSQSTVFAPEVQLIEAARAGDSAALVEFLYDRLMGRAVRLVGGFREAYGARLDAEDVAMEGAVEVLRLMSKALAEATSPVGWLLHAAQLRMLHFCQEQRSLIRVPAASQYQWGAKAPFVVSLDAPLRGREDLTLADVLESSTV